MRTIVNGVACALLLISSATVTAQSTQAPKRDSDVARGRYLVKIAGCNDCHTEGYAPSRPARCRRRIGSPASVLGFQGDWGTTYPANLRLAMSSMTEAQWMKGARQPLRPPMPWFALRDMTDSDLRAIYRYIKSLGPAGKPAPAYVPPGGKVSDTALRLGAAAVGPRQVAWRSAPASLLRRGHRGGAGVPYNDVPSRLQSACASAARCSSTPSRSSSARSCCSSSSRSIAKQILPWFGGSATVWTTCLVFFQTDAARGLRVRRLDRAPARAAALGAAARRAARASASLVLPIMPGELWKPGGDENPSWLILGMLGGDDRPARTSCCRRRARSCRPGSRGAFPARSPYRLFALSNLASMLALLGYPFLLEPWVATRAQAWGWSAGYALFVGLCAARRHCEPRARRRRRRARGVAQRRQRCAAGAGDARRRRRPPARQLLWCTLAATGVDPAARRVEPHHAERRVGAAAVDRAARALSADVHPLLRRHRLVQARHLPVDGWRRRSASWRGRSPIRASRTSSRSRSACSASACSSPACSATASSCGSSPRRATSRAST